MAIKISLPKFLKKLRYIIFCSKTLDSAFNGLLKFNRLRRLVTLNVNSGSSFSLPALRLLALDTCPLLTHVTFPQSPGMSMADVDALKAEVTSRNLDLELSCMEIYEPPVAQEG